MVVLARGCHLVCRWPTNGNLCFQPSALLLIIQFGHRMDNGWFSPVAIYRKELAVVICIYLTSHPMDGAHPRTWVIPSIQNPGNRRLLYHPIKEIYISPVVAPMDMAVVIFMWAIVYQMADSANLKILGHSLTHPVMKVVPSCTPIIKRFTLLPMDILDMEGMICLWLRKGSKAPGVNPLTLATRSIP